MIHFEKIEAWEQDDKILSQFGKDFELNAMTHIVALENRMAKFKTDYEQIERSMPENIAEKPPEARLQYLLGAIKKRATRRRLDCQRMSALRLFHRCTRHVMAY